MITIRFKGTFKELLEYLDKLEKQGDTQYDRV